MTHIEITMFRKDGREAFSVAGAFVIDLGTARTIAAEVGAAISGWRQIAERNGLTPTQIERLESAFEHADPKKGSRHRN